MQVVKYYTKIHRNIYMASFILKTDLFLYNIESIMYNVIIYKYCDQIPWKYLNLL